MKEEGRSAGCIKGRTRFFQTRTMHSYAMRYLLFYCTRLIHTLMLSNDIGGKFRRCVLIVLGFGYFALDLCIPYVIGAATLYAL